jgi:hypothetical protein
MRAQFGTLLTFAAVAALGACASNGPARATRAASAGGEFPGYVRVVRHGQELFCSEEIPIDSHIMQAVCLTRDQLKERERDLERWRASAPASYMGQTSTSSFSPSGH